MSRVFGTSEFERLTGISRPTLQRRHISGDLTARINSKGHRTYRVEDLFIPYVVKHMKHKNLKIPESIKREYIGDNLSDYTEPPKLKIVEKKVLPFTAEKKLEKLPSGLIVKYLKPLANMNEEARSIWDYTLPDLIEFDVIHKCDLHTLKNYCMVQSQITRMEGELASSNFLDEANRPNPLMAAIDKAKNTARSLAVSLQITPLGRKGIIAQEKTPDDAAAWDKILK